MKKTRSASLMGFLTLIMIFLVVCLAMIGASALSATSGGDRLIRRTEEHLTAYRSARNLSEKRLAEVDGCIAAAAHSGLFDLNFEALVSELDYVTCRDNGDSFTVSCSTPIDGNSSVYWEIKVDKYPSDGRGSYELAVMRTQSASDAGSEDEDEHINVWLG